MKRNQGYSVIFSVLLILSLTSIFIRGIVSLFSVVPAVIFTVFLIYNCLPEESIERISGRKWFKIIYKTVTNISLFTGILCGACFVVMIFYSLGTTAENPTTVVVLGCQVKDDEPSLMLKMRLDTAYGYLSENEKAVAIVSGGQGPDEKHSESSVMKKYLVEKGISADRITEERESVNTKENIENSAKIIETNKWSKDILIVTDWWHQLRANKIAENAGMSVSARSTFTDILLVEPMFFREVCAVVKLLIMGV